MRVIPGMVRVALEPEGSHEPLVPDSWFEDQVLELEHVEAITPSGASGYLIITVFDSLEEAGVVLPNLCHVINDIFARHQKRPACQVTGCPESGEVREPFCDNHAWIATGR